MDNKKIILGLAVLATPFVVENITEENIASANTTYNLTETVKVYGTAQNASKQANSNKTYEQGTYYVYKQHNGMINISKTPGKAGAWINPATGKTAEVATQPQTSKETSTVKPANLSLVSPKEGQYSILKSTDAYVNAIDASKKVNAKGKVSAGNYYIFREYKGMLNVSRAQGKVGSWINPGETTVAADTKASTQITPQTTQPTVQTNTTVQKTNSSTKTKEPQTGYITSNGRYTLTNPTIAYTNAADASKKTNPRGRVSAGTYYIFREYRGMLNISRAQGKAGSWINPGIVEEPKETTSTVETTLSSTSSQRQNTTTQVVDTTAGKYTLTNPTQAYVNAIDASKKVNAKGLVASGTYHIFREYKGMLNISKTQGRAGSWINPGSTTVASPTQSATPTTNPKPETKTEEKVQAPKQTAGMYTLASATETYVTAADASRKVNARGKVSAGNYYIYREYNGMLNVSRVKGKVGSWINPSLDSKVETEETSKLPETASVTREVSGTGVTYYTQDDARWGSKRYGISNMKHAGCVPTSLAMAISTLGQKVSPVAIADYLYNNTSTFNKKYEGTTSDGIPAVLNKYGLKYKVLSTKSGLQSELGKGNLVLSLVQGADFVTPGYTHAVVAKGLDSAGKTTVYNPLTRWGVKKFTTDKLFNSQSMDKIDRTLGGAFISIFK